MPHRIAGETIDSVHATLRVAGGALTITTFEAARDQARLTAAGQYSFADGRYTVNASGTALAIDYALKPVLAALGLATVEVVRRPRVAILSTGDEIIAPGQPMRPGLVYDSNAIILADAVRELGGEPVPLGIVPDDADALRRALERALVHDVVLLSGGTSKGEGDVSYRVVGGLGEAIDLILR